MTKYSEKKIKDLIIQFKNTPSVLPNETVYQSILQMNNTGIGIVCIIDKNKKLKGIITDGDLRRILMSLSEPLPSFLNNNIAKYMNKKPFVISENMRLKKIIDIMGKRKIWDVPVVKKNKELIGLCHLHNILKVLIKDG